MIEYTLEFDLNRSGLFDNPDGWLANRLVDASWTLGMMNAFNLVARPMQLRMTVLDPNLDFSQDLGTSPLSAILRDMLVRLRATVNGTTRTLVTAWIVDVQPEERAFGTVATITAEDRMLILQDAEYLPQLSTDIRIDTELQNIFDSGVMGYPYDNHNWIVGYSRVGIDTRVFQGNFTDFEQSYTTLDWAGDAADRGNGVSGMGYIMDLITAEFGGRFFVNRDGKFAFHNRHHDVFTLLSDTFSDDPLSGYTGFTPIQGEVYNEVVVNFYPRTVGSAGSVLFTAPNLPLTVNPGKTRKVTMRYYDPDNDDAKVGAQDVITPVATTDYSANSQADGAGTNVTTDLRWVFEIGATSTIANIENPTDSVAYIQSLRVRGTPLIAYQPEQEIARDATSIGKYGRVPFPPVDAKFISEQNTALGYANQLLARYKTPSTRYTDINFTIQSLDGSRDDLAERVLANTIGDKLRVTNSITGHDRVYAVVGEYHQVSGGTHFAQYILRTADTNTGVWIVGYSRIGIDAIVAL